MDDDAAPDATRPASAGDAGPDGKLAPAAPRPLTDRTRIRRHADRAVPDRVEEFLRTALVAHVACVEDGEPRVIPFLYHYEAGTMYIHGSVGNATLRMLRDGRSVAIAVSTIVELVASKIAATHSANYRSVVIYGHGAPVEDVAEKRRVFEAMTDRYWPGRAAPADYTTAPDDELRKVELTAIEIDEASAKMREGGSMRPEDDDPDYPGSAFIHPV